MVIRLEWSGMDNEQGRSVIVVIERISNAVIGLIKTGVYEVRTALISLTIILASLFLLNLYMTV